MKEFHISQSSSHTRTGYTYKLCCLMGIKLCSQTYNSNNRGPELFLDFMSNKVLCHRILHMT